MGDVLTDRLISVTVAKLGMAMQENAGIGYLGDGGGLLGTSDVKGRNGKL